MYPLQILATHPPGPTPHGGPLSGMQPAGMQLIGSPHVLILLVCLLLLFYLRATTRSDQKERQRWMEWALLAGVVTELFVLGMRVAAPLPFQVIRPWSAQLLEHVVRQGTSVLLAVGCLRYLLDARQPAQRYGIFSTAVIGVTGIFAGFLQWNRHPGVDLVGKPPTLQAESVVAFMGLASMVGALGLVYRYVQGSGRRLTFAAFGSLTAAQFGHWIGSMDSFGPTPRPAYPFVLTCSALALLLMTYLFLRLRSEEIHTDMDLLEDRVRVRTKELEAALDQLADANALLEQQSSVDTPTGAGNRRRFDDALTTEWNRARRTGKPISVAMIDLDRFKEINDIHGHPVGDQCLVALAGALQRAARRPADLVARLGGDEFAVLLPETAGEAAAQSLDDVRRQAALFTSPAASDLTIMISVGVASCVPSPAESAEALIQYADKALYQAKRSGRNRVALSESGALQVL